jgi:hypothetical protein
MFDIIEEYSYFEDLLEEMNCKNLLINAQLIRIDIKFSIYYST